jgi:hypothetical protein
LKSLIRAVVRTLLAAATWSAPAAAGPPRAIDGWEELHFGLRPPDVLRALPGGSTNLDLCDPRVRRIGLGRSGERCERVEGRVHVGYLPFDASVYFSRATGRAVRIRLVLPRCEAAHEIEGKGGRIALELCVRQPCPGAADLLTPAASAAVGSRILDIELTAALAPGESPR